MGGDPSLGCKFFLKKRKKKNSCSGSRHILPMKVESLGKSLKSLAV